jgi:putative peptide maturation dehydrogenase
MTSIRRTSHTFFHSQDRVFFDLDQLFRGTAVLEPLKEQILAISILKSEEYPISIEALQILFEIPSDEWISSDQITKRYGVADDFIEDLAHKGLILSKQPDEPLPELIRRDKILTDTQWNKYALLYHYMTKWKDMHLHITLPENIEQLARAKAISDEKFKEFTDHSGKPPNHFHAIPNPIYTHDLPVVKRDNSLYDVLTKRKTTRTFDTKTPMTREELSIILYYVYGCHGYSPVFEDIVGVKKTSPSGGGLHPTEVYPLIINVDGLDPGIYHYNIENHRLDMIIRLDQAEARELANEFTAGQSYPRRAHALFVMTARFYRQFWKYRKHPKAYAVLYMDAAHLSQSFYLVCTELGLGAFITGAINAVNIEQKLCLDGTTEGAIAVCGCGKPLGKDLALEPEYFTYIPRETQL